MAPKKAKTPESDIEIDNSANELDQAIDDLRGVLKADETGDTGLGGDFPSGDDTPAFGSEFGADLDTVGSSDFGSEFGGGADFGGTSDFADGSFGGSLSNDIMAEPGSAMHANLDLIMNIPIDVQIILGESRMQVSGLMNLTEGAIISLDRKIGEPVDLVVNGRLIGRGEITVLEHDETRFGIRLIEVSSAKKA
jgi:flagellar motor switch protein FliN